MKILDGFFERFSECAGHLFGYLATDYFVLLNGFVFIFIL